MVFSSLFGKKEETNKAKTKSVQKTAGDKRTSAGVAAPPKSTQPMNKNDAAHRELARATAKKIDDIESEMSLDFMPPKPLPGKPAVKPPAEKPSNVAAPDTRGAKVKPTKVKTDSFDAVAEQDPKTLPPIDSTTSIILGDSIGSMALEITGSAAAPIIEEVAILYANGQALAAMAALAAAIKEDQLGPSTNQGWLMLFDLYQILNKKAEFESLALDYVGKFELSPPAWVDSAANNKAAVPTKAAAAAPTGLVALDAGIAATIEQLKKQGERNQQLKLDLSAITEANAEGCALLLKAFASFRKSKHVLVLDGVAHLQSLLQQQLEVGRRDPSDAPWLLMLELLKVLGKQDEFEEKSIDYCVTFEISPPAWEDVRSFLRAGNEPPPTTIMPVPVAKPSMPELVREGYKLVGDLEGKAEIELSKLSAYAAERSIITIDCRGLKRVDFAAGGTLLNLLVGLTSSGKKIEFVEVNHLVAALFVVMGIHELALLNIKK